MVTWKDYKIIEEFAKSPAPSPKLQRSLYAMLEQCAKDYPEIKKEAEKAVKQKVCKKIAALKATITIERDK